MKKRNKWLRPILSLVIIAALAVGGYFIAQSMMSGRGVSAQAGDIDAVMNSIRPQLIVIVGVLDRKSVV